MSNSYHACNQSMRPVRGLPVLERTRICTERSYRGPDRHTIVARSAVCTPAPRARAAADRAVVDLREYEDQCGAVRVARTRRRLALAVGNLPPQFHPRLRERHRG